MDSGISGKTYLVETVDPSLDGPVGNEPDGDSRRRFMNCAYPGSFETYKKCKHTFQKYLHTSKN